MKEGEREVFYPTEDNIGKNCSFWSIERGGAHFQKKKWKEEEAVRA